MPVVDLGVESKLMAGLSVSAGVAFRSDLLNLEVTSFPSLVAASRNESNSEMSEI